MKLPAGEFFARQDLLFDHELLANKSVAIIGAGGLGSAYAYALASVGLKQLAMVDFDSCEASNISRQIMFTSDDVGQLKVSAFNKLSDRSFSTIITDCDYAKSWLAKNGADYSLIIDATDNLSARKDIAEFSNCANIPWLFSSVEGFYFSFGLISKREELIFSHEQSGIKAQTTPVVMSCASFAAALALRFLANLDAPINRLFYANLAEFSLESFAL